MDSLLLQRVDQPTVELAQGEAGATIHAESVGFDWSTAESPDVAVGGATLPMPEAMQLALVVLAVDGSEQRLDVRFDQRMAADQRLWLRGADRSGSFRVRLEVEPAPGRLRLRFAYHPLADASPSELLHVIDFLEALSAGEKIGIQTSAIDGWGAAPELLPPDRPRLPKQYSDVIRLLARLEKLANVRLAVPEEITAEDARGIRQAVELLSGETVTGQWTAATLVVDDDGLTFVRDAVGQHGARLELVSDSRLDVGGHEIELASIEQVFRQVFIDDVQAADEAGWWNVRLTPGEQDTFEARQIVEPHLGLDRPTALEEFAGRWIAQSGVEVVAAADDPQELIAQLRTAGWHGAIWRVPRSRDEAEATTWA